MQQNLNLNFKLIELKFLTLVVVSFFLAGTTVAQHLVLKDGYQAQYVEEAVLPVSNNAYVLVKDSTAYLYNATSVLPHITQKLKDSYIVNAIDNKLYSISLVPQYMNQIDESTQELTTLVTYLYEVKHGTATNSKELIKQYGYIIPKKAVSEAFAFNETIHIEDTYTTSVYQQSHALLPSHHLRIDKNNVLSVDAKGNLMLVEAKKNKVTNKKIWTNFKGSINLLRCIKIGDVVRVNFQLDQSEAEEVASFWSIINLKTQNFVPIDLKEFYTNVEQLHEQDVPLLNSIPFFYKATNNSNIKLFVLPNKNFVWLDEASYYYGSDDLSKYASMQKEGKNYNLNLDPYNFNHPSRILKAIAPQEKEKIRELEETYTTNKQKTSSDSSQN